MSDIVASMRNVDKTFGDFCALDNVDFDIVENRIYGLLGRNGAGKTTIMALLTGQDTASSGAVRLFGEDPFENSDVLANMCFVKESQKYPDNLKVKHVLTCAAYLLPGWDQQFAESLMEDFELPANRKVRKLSRGMTSALGVIVGLAARAPITFFDEPYLGLDAASRQMFYERLLADYSETPRTVVLSTHLIDEVSELIESVILVDRGHVLLDGDADQLRSCATTVTGPASDVEKFIAGKEVLNRYDLGARSRIVIKADLSADERSSALARGIDLAPVSLQQLVIDSTAHQKESVR